MSKPSQIDGGHLDNERSLFQLLESSLQTKPDAAAVVCMHQGTDVRQQLFDDVQHIDGKDCLVLLYSDLFRAAMRIAVGLKAAGVHPGSRMLVCIDNGAEFCILLWVAIIYRLTIICLDPSMLKPSSHDTLLTMLRMLRPSLVVANEPKDAVSVDIAVSTLKLARPLGITLRQTYADWKTLTALSVKDVDSIEAEVMLDSARYDDPDRVHSILFTSGTSGLPKGCPLRLRGQTHFLQSWSWLIGKHNATAALNQAHSSRAIAPTQLLQTWVAGGTVVMPSRSFDVEDTISAIEKHGATFVVLSPPMVHAIAAILRQRPIDTSSVKTVQIGGDAVTKDTLSRCAALFPQSKVCVVHGMSEGVSAFRWPFFDMDVSAIPFLGESCPVGEVAPGAVVRLWDSTKKKAVPRGMPGELQISSDSIIKAYFHGRSSESFYKSEGRTWFVTGDVAVMDESGLVYILGRAKDMIRRAGVVIMPAIVESCIEKFTGQQACVVAVPDPLFGQQPYAVMSSTMQPAEEKAVVAHVQATFGRECQLAGVLSLQTLGLERFPVNATFKIVRQDIEQALLASLRRAGRI